MKQRSLRILVLSLVLISPQVFAKSVNFPEIEFKIFNGFENISSKVQASASYLFYGGITSGEAADDVQNKFTTPVSVESRYDLENDSVSVNSFKAKSPSSGPMRPWYFSGLEIKIELPLMFGREAKHTLELSLTELDLKYLVKRFGKKLSSHYRLSIPLYVPAAKFVQLKSKGGTAKCLNGETVNTYVDINGSEWVVTPDTTHPEDFISELNARIDDGPVSVLTDPDMTWGRSNWEPYIENRSRQSLKTTEADSYHLCGPGPAAISGIKAYAIKM